MFKMKSTGECLRLCKFYELESGTTYVCITEADMTGKLYSVNYAGKLIVESACASPKVKYIDSRYHATI